MAKGWAEGTNGAVQSRQVVSNITVALDPPALDPIPTQATTATAQPAALTDSLRGSIAVHLA